MERKTIFDLAGRLCVVTGGGRGIGKSVVDEIRAASGQADWLTADISSETAVVRLAEMVQERFGPVEVLVNNAGVNAIYKGTEKTTLDEWNAIIGTNLTGVFLACREFGRQMLAAARGSIINISSIGGRTGLGQTAAYCASKGGVELMSKAIAIDWASKGVRVNCVAPAYIETDLTSGIVEHPILGARITARTPMGRFGKPDEIAGAVAFLASDAASYLTGESIAVDGGWTGS